MSSSSEGLELPIWLGGCEKWVTGLTKRTTCDDVIYALVKHSRNPNDDDSDISCFSIFERWRDVERPLRGRTKIMKVWRAWGEECSNVQFSVRKTEGPYDTRSEITRTRRSRKYTSARERRSREKKQSRPMTIGPGVRHKDYGPIDGNGYIDDQCKAHAFHELVQVVIEQEKKIQEQYERIRETDAQIENYETKMHELRMRENGENYVQEAYLRDRAGEDSSSGGEDLFPAIKAKDLEAYMHICENILQLEERISGEQSRILDISHQIQEETILEAPPTPARFPPPSVECREGAGSGPLTPVPEDLLQEEVERLRSELQRGQCLTEAQQHQLQLVELTMSELDTQITQRGEFIKRMRYEYSIAEHATIAPPPPNTTGYPSGFTQDRHSSSTSGVSEVSEVEGSDRSTSRSRHPDHCRGRSGCSSPDRTNDGYPPRDKSREVSRDRSVPAHSSRGRYGWMPEISGGGSNSEVDRSRVTFCNTTISRGGCESVSGGPLLPDNPPVVRDGEGSVLYTPVLSHTTRQSQQYYVTRAYYSPPCSYRDTYLNQAPNTVSDDSNSDTGLSSLHSDEAPPVLETLV